MSGRGRISLAVVSRLPRYYRYLGDLLDKDIVRISSKDLSDIMGITSSQIRQDFNNFGCFGQQGYGYNVEFLYNEIKKILGLNKVYSLIIIGAGNIGQALINYISSEKRGFINFVAVFDINPKLIGINIKGLKVRDIDTLANFANNNSVDIAVLCVPKNNAIKVSKIISDCGIKGIWNFSNVDLGLKKDIMVENVHLIDSLMTLLYRVKEFNFLEKI